MQILSRPLNPLPHDAFLSFFGKETRKEFTVPLYHALWRGNINTYIDDIGIPRGENIPKALFEAIEKSKISIVVLSPGYASSKWCLDELFKIHECMKRKGQLVYPIFHGIESSEAKDLSNGCYAQAMAQHEKNFYREKVLRWRVALFDIADLEGPRFIYGGDKDQFIGRIVGEISQKLKYGAVGPLSGRSLPRSHSDAGPRHDFSKVVGRNGIGEKDARWNKVFLGSPKEAQPKILHPSSCQKKPELGKNEGFMMVLPSMMGECTSKARHELLGPKMSVVQCNVLSNVQYSVEIDMKKSSIRNEAGAETNAEITFAPLVKSLADQGSASKQFAGGLNSMELNRNHFGSTLNGTSLEAMLVLTGTETNPLSLAQDAGNVSIRTHENTKCSLQLLKTFVSKRFCDLLDPARSRFIKGTLNNLLNTSEDYIISVKMSSVLRKLLNCFIQWSQYYENASITVESTTTELSKVSDPQEGLPTTIKESHIVVSSKKELCNHELACLMEEKTQLEEQLMAVNAKIADLTSSKRATGKRKRSLRDEERELKDKMDDAKIQEPRLRAERKAATLTQVNIEAEWCKLTELFTNIFRQEFGSS